MTLPMTQNHTALVAELRAATMRFDWGDLPDDACIPAVPLLKKAADAIASLERQLAEVRGERGKQVADLTVKLDEEHYLLTEWQAHATTAEAERDRLTAMCGELERALRAVRDWDALHDAFPTELATTVRAALGASNAE